MDPTAGAKPISARDFDAALLLLQAKGRMPMRVASGSMLPVIQVGEVIDVEPLGPDEVPARFDILVFWNERLLICHYLWHVNQLRNPGEARTFITRSLGGHEDLPFSESQVLGRVVSHRLSRFWRFRLALTRVLRNK